jgi:ankyrin repeat protein
MLLTRLPPLSSSLFSLRLPNPSPPSSLPTPPSQPSLSAAQEGRTALHAAARNGHAEAAVALLRGGARADAKGPVGGR